MNIYTDGSCVTSRKKASTGGWGVYIEELDIELSGYSKSTTNNRMEMQAAIEALKYCQKHKLKNIFVLSDSQYLIQGITKWIYNWRKQNFKKVKNVDLWKELYNINKQISAKWRWIRGHSGNLGNEKADGLAKQARINEGKKNPSIKKVPLKMNIGYRYCVYCRCTYLVLPSIPVKIEGFCDKKCKRNHLLNKPKPNKFWK